MLKRIWFHPNLQIALLLWAVNLLAFSCVDSEAQKKMAPVPEQPPSYIAQKRQNGESPKGPAERIPIGAGPSIQEETAAIDSIISGWASAYNEFPRSRDPQSILKIYSRNFTGIYDGQPSRYADVQKRLQGWAERFALGNQAGMVVRGEDVSIHVDDRLAWVTYKTVYKTGTNGQVVSQEEGFCSDVFSKDSGAWLLVHEHCSTTKVKR
jgi:ketosteroid isomerase-like protein